MQNTQEIMKRVPPTQGAMLWLLRRERDVYIETMYDLLRTDPQTPRRKQQIVAAVLSRLNKVLLEYGYEVKPGTKRRTYRLRPLPHKR